MITEHSKRKAVAKVILALLCTTLSLVTALAQAPPPPAPAPSTIPPVPAVSPQQITRPQVFQPGPNSLRNISPPTVPLPLNTASSLPTATPKRVILIQPPAPAFQPHVNAAMPAVASVDTLAWDAESKESNPKPGEMSSEFTFNLTNISPAEVLINRVHTSCGCTVAKLPEQPWRIAPGGGGPIGVTVNLAGKIGTFTKMVTVDTSSGSKTLYVKVNMPPPATDAAAAGANGPGGNNMNRLANMQTALADRQAVFKNDCAKCHAEPALDKTGQEVHGKELYTAVCGICHDSPHRAGMVPDLYTLKHPTDEAYWKQWITAGKSGTMMPAFAKAEGGPLSDAQIGSLVKHLTETVTHKPTAQITPRPVTITAPATAATTSARPPAAAGTTPPPPPTLLAAPNGSSAPPPSPARPE